MPWRTSLLVGYWLILGRDIDGSICILMRDVLWILPVSAGDFAHKEEGSWFSKDKWSVFLELALVLSETEQMKDVKGSFNSPGWLLWWLLSNSRIMFPFQEKEILTWHFSKKSEPDKWVEVKGLRRKGCVSLREPKQKEIGSETGTSWGSSGIPTIWTVSMLQGRGCFVVVGLSTENSSGVS